MLYFNTNVGATLFTPSQGDSEDGEVLGVRPEQEKAMTGR